MTCVVSAQPTGVPYSFINLKTREASPDADNNGFSSLAEATFVCPRLSSEQCTDQMEHAQDIAA